MSRQNKANSSLPVTCGISSLADELLLRIFQHCSTLEKLKRLPLVCKRWKRLSGDSELWKVIDIDPRKFSNSAVQTMVRTYGGKRTRVLRICRRDPEHMMRMRIPAKSTWEAIMTHCSNIEELCLERLNVETFRQYYYLPDTLRRLYINGCTCYKRLKNSQLFLSLSNHKSLELVDFRGSFSIFNFKASGPMEGVNASVLRTLPHLKYINLNAKCFYPDRINLLETLPMHQLTHLDLSGFNNLKYEVPFRAVLRDLHNLRILNVTRCILTIEDSLPFNCGWILMWTDTVPNLELIKLCGAQGYQTGVREYCFLLEDPFVDRESVTVICCTMVHGDPDYCESPPLVIPSATTFIPL